MKALALITLFLAIGISAYAQTRLDSLGEAVSSSDMLDRVDSASQAIVQLPDSLLPSFHRIDSIRAQFNTSADSLRQEYRNTLGTIDATANDLNHRIDSMRSLALPMEKYTRKLDSLNTLRQNLETKLTSRLNDLKSRAAEKLSALDLPPEYEQPLRELTEKMNRLTLNSDALQLPELKIPGYTLPDFNVPGLPGTQGIGNINDIAQVPDLGSPLGDAGNVTGKVQEYQDQLKNAVPDELGQVTEQAQAYGQDIRSVTEGNIGDVEKLPETLEQQALKVDGMEELQKQSQLIRQQEVPDAEEAKKQAAEMARKAAVDHFAGKQEQLKAAMDKVSKYKQKYSSVSSIRDLPKRPPNPMKAKPFMERLVPGLYLQYQQKTFYLVDVNPYVGYRLSGRFTTGVGWNHRYAWDHSRREFDWRSRIFGPRAYVDFKLGKGFIAHVEGEVMNTFVPSTLRGNPDAGEREWVWSCMTGIKKEYRIYKGLKGTALVQYNLFNPLYKSPYVDRLNSRIGFEYVVKKSKKSRKP